MTALPHRVPPRALAALLVAGVALGSGTGWALGHGTAGGVTKAAVQVPVAAPVLTTVGLAKGAVPWGRPLSLALTDGTLEQVAATDPDGQPLPGTLSPTGWTSTAPDLLPSSTYRLTAVVKDLAGGRRTVPLTVRTTAPAHVLKAVLSPGDGKVVGVGMPVVVTLSRPVKGSADRAAVVARLGVTSSPAVAGAWRWMSDSELHYRGPAYWAKGTTITARADLDRLKLSDGTWGSGARTTAYSIGRAVISTVDVATKTMVVRVDGKVVRTLKVSTGRDKYPTKGGVHLVLEKTRLKTMDSSTIGIPRGGPGGYYLKVPNSVRISYSGEFVHSAQGTVRQQGVANVSHGCVNLSPADAKWFYELATRGDVVDVVHAKAKPLSYDPGTSDWNLPFSAWAN